MGHRRRPNRRRLKMAEHEGIRTACRVLGPIGILAGFGMITASVYDFSASFGDFDKSPDLFWLAFPGMLILMGGIALTRIGFLGAAARYVAGETAPVASDTMNYVADGVKDSVRELSGAIADGIREDSPAGARCRRCNTENDIDAKFCKGCGDSLDPSVTCASCHHVNDLDARFCDHCGVRMPGGDERDS